MAYLPQISKCCNKHPELIQWNYLSEDYSYDCIDYAIRCCVCGRIARTGYSFTIPTLKETENRLVKSCLMGIITNWNDHTKYINDILDKSGYKTNRELLDSLDFFWDEEL